MPVLLCIVDPSLKDFIGHHFAYDASTAAAFIETGGEAVILAHREVEAAIRQAAPVRPAFSLDMWGVPSWCRGRWQQLGSLFANIRFLRELRRGLRSLKAEQRIIFGHMITQRQMLAWGLFAWLFARPTDRLVLLLRYETRHYAGTLAALGFMLLERAARNGRVRLSADSNRLSSAYEMMTLLPVEVFPIPHSFDVADRPPLEDGDPITLVSLGNARDEKGILEIIAAIRALAAADELSRLRFVLQLNDPAPDIKPAIDAFLNDLPPNCEGVTTALDADAYLALLASADAVLVPYWRSVYEARTSGVFFEALYAGKPVIATDDTWMSDQLAEHGAGVLCRDRDPGDLGRAIRALRDDFPRLQRDAVAHRDAWRALHSGASLARVLLGETAPRAVSAPPRRVAVMYPWGDFGNMHGGASRRVTTLVDFLHDKVPEIRVLQGENQPPATYRGITVETHPANRYRLTRIARESCRRALFIALATVTLGRSRGQETMLWLHLRPLLSRSFACRVGEMVRWADVVLLEYTFWAPLVARVARQAGVKVILTNYDVLSNQVTRKGLLHAMTERRERRCLALADHRVMVSPRDTEFWHARGLDCLTVPISIDQRQFSSPLPLPPSAIVRDLFGIALPVSAATGKPLPFAFFVGSAFEPNFVAVKHLRGIAKGLAKLGPEAPVIVVAGRCAPPDRQDNFIALGSVHEALLVALYRLATIIVAPLPFGTGISVKTLEAMGAGKPILGTPAAFRGLDIEDGVHGLVETDIAAYPARISQLAKDPILRARIAAAGLAASQTFEFRTTYRTYLPLLGLPDNPPTEQHGLAESALRHELWRDLLHVARQDQRQEVAEAIRQALRELPDYDGSTTDEFAVEDQLSEGLAGDSGGDSGITEEFAVGGHPSEGLTGDGGGDGGATKEFAMEDHLSEALADTDDATSHRDAPAATALMPRSRPIGRLARFRQNFRKALGSWRLLEHVNHQLHEQAATLATLSMRLGQKMAAAESRETEARRRQADTQIALDSMMVAAERREAEAKLRAADTQVALDHMIAAGEERDAEARLLLADIQMALAHMIAAEEQREAEARLQGDKTHAALHQMMAALESREVEARVLVAETRIALDEHNARALRSNQASVQQLEQAMRGEADRAGMLIDAATRTALGAARFALRQEYGQISVATAKPIALDSPDHLQPWGTARDDFRNVRFNARLRTLLGMASPSVLDLGCSGGGAVRSFVEEGVLAVGIEGSDYSRRRLRAQWKTIPEFLFTADITTPFEVRAARAPGALKFTTVTLWEVIEHIREADLAAVFRNIDVHLTPDGLVVMSIATVPDVIEGVALHQTVHDRAWWLEKLDELGWRNHPKAADYFGGDVVRGPADAPSSFLVVLTRQTDEWHPPAHLV